MQEKNKLRKACDEVAGFSEFYQRLKQRMSLMGKSDSTLDNYAHHLALLTLRFHRLPVDVEADEINNYLYELQQMESSPSQSYFKFAVYSLRFAYRMEGMPEKSIRLPSIKRDKKLPVVLSREEVRRLLATPKSLKHRLLIGLLYGCGLRCFEVRNVRLADIDLDRKMLHVRKGKGRKDRYVPLSSIHVEWIREYVATVRPTEWLFNGQPRRRLNLEVETHYSPRGVGWVIRKIARDAGIIKQVSPHTLRHTYATHLLEDGLDIVSIKDLLGHAAIETTLVYLHVAHYDRVKSFSPLDTLYNVREAQYVQRRSIGHCNLISHILECEDCGKSGLATMLKVEDCGG